MIDFTLTEQQEQLRQNSATFKTQVLSRARGLYEKHSTQAARFQSTRPLYAEAVKYGMIRGQIPAALGGGAGLLVDAAIIVEEIYATDPSTALTVLGAGLGLTPLILAGTKEQQERLFKPFLSGEGDPLASLVHSEPQGTANWLEVGAKGLQTTARKDGDNWIINGEKLWTTSSGGWHGEGAALQCVVCRHAQDGEPQSPTSDPRNAILILLVTPEVIAKNAKGAYQVLSEPELGGHIASSGPHSRFTNLRVPAENVLAPPGKGALVIEQTFGMSAAIVGAMSVSIMKAVFEAALDFAKSDTRGGATPILERQSVADVLIDIKMKIEASRLLTWKAMHCLENGPGDMSARLELALEAKIYCSDNATKCCVDAMKVVGMSSYAKELPFVRLLNDAICLPLFDGGNLGIRRRQIEKIFQQKDYKPWAATYLMGGNG